MAWEKIEMKPGGRMLRPFAFGENTQPNEPMHYYIRFDWWSVGWRYTWKARPEHKMAAHRSPWWRR